MELHHVTGRGRADLLRSRRSSWFDIAPGRDLSACLQRRAGSACKEVLWAGTLVGADRRTARRKPRSVALLRRCRLPVGCRGARCSGEDKLGGACAVTRIAPPVDLPQLEADPHSRTRRHLKIINHDQRSNADSDDDGESCSGRNSSGLPRTTTRCEALRRALAKSSPRLLIGAAYAKSKAQGGPDALSWAPNSAFAVVFRPSRC